MREVVVALPEERAVRCYDPSTGEPLEVSRLLGVDLQALSDELDWPA